MKSYFPLLLLGLFFLGGFVGCSTNKPPEKIRNVDYTIVPEEDIPEELMALIEERKKKTFELTYLDQDYLYVVKGFGKEESRGFQIKIDGFYETKNGLFFDTSLFGPKKQDQPDPRASYPYIVIKTERRETSVEFS